MVKLLKSYKSGNNKGCTAYAVQPFKLDKISDSISE
ncbi:hypothetical protein RF007C_09680 [Ruminococcus flavefaciens 007c]|uniref:Uncharacterized protein n=1 Tax=Ruminococcus flavefaciens 007c TaxID=1341157 RepID=W7UDM5_RUMFL|nr:hypothetical protein RF007C_09680 [Ruminococcus flavefaciens 007c]